MGSSIKILVTGSNGQVGSEIKELSSSYLQYEFIFVSREALSIVDEAAVQKAFELHRPQFVINCAAYTAVDKAEQEKDLSISVNATAVGTLARMCKLYNAKFVHLSTDYVFDGTSQQPLKESDPVCPVNSYGEGKLLGEQLAMKENADSLIIRTAWVYSSYGKNFVKTMIRLMNEKESINVVNDQIGSPTYAADLADAILQIIDSGKWIAGIYNYSNDGVISWFDFANEIKKLIGSPCVVNPVPTEQFPTPAKRPKYSVLDKSRIKEVYAVPLKDWKASLKNCISKIAAT
jgi:dTDP-4-dehydrorhamnose reductase